MNNLNVKSNGDPWVLNVQNWLNETYNTVSGWGSVPEDGRTGWPTIYGIIKAVQHELGITSLANNFGVTTQAKWDAKISSLLVLGTKHRIIKLIDAGMICKGMGRVHLAKNIPNQQKMLFSSLSMQLESTNQLIISLLCGLKHYLI